MLLHLMKKDMLIVKKHACLTVLTAVLIPPFMLWRAPEHAGALGFMLAAIFSVFMLMQTLSFKECQFPRAAALLCASPFSRTLMVISKYAVYIGVYAACCAIYGVETLLIPELGGMDIRLLILVFFAVAAFIGVYLPVQYRLGYERTKFVFMVVIVSSPMILPYLMKLENAGAAFFHAPAPVYGVIALAGCALLAVSALVSVRIYEQTDLA